jgi:signal transduction histidine kinase
MFGGSRFRKSTLHLLLWPTVFLLLLLGILRNERAAEAEAGRLLDRYGDLLQIHLWNFDVESATSLLDVVAEAGTFGRLEVRHADGRLFAEHPPHTVDLPFYVRRIPLSRSLEKDGTKIGELRAEWHNRELGGYLGIGAMLALLAAAGTVTIRLVAQSSELLERIRSEAVLRRAKAEAERANRLKTEFLANMSHEIRTPLNIILGSIDLLEENIDPQRTGPHSARLEAIRNAGERLRDTIHKIVDISRLRLSEFPFHPETIQLELMLAETCRTMAVLAERKGLRFDVHVPPEPPVVVRMDLYALRQSIFNLIDNAIKYTQSGWVRVELATSSSEAVITVADTGIGIGEDFAGDLFRPFSQEDTGPGRQFEGTGLGLALAHEFLTAGGARIGVTSKSGQGTTFTVRIPLHGDNAAPAAAPVPRPSEPPAARSDDRTIVVVEDDAATQEFMQAALECRGRIEIAADADALDELLKSLRVDLILMDVSLRGSEDGLSIATRLKADPVFQDIPIIALTGYAMESDRDRAIAAGCDAYLSKPCPLDVLRATVDRLLPPA